MALPYRGLRPSQEDREIKRFIGSQEVQEDQEGRRKRLSSRRFTGFDAKILALYARGMTVREIQAFLSEMYVVEVSPDLISTVCDSLRGSLQFPLLPDLPELPVI